MPYTPKAYWQEQALCRDYPQEWWYGGPDGRPQSARLLNKAKSLCQLCPVLRDCLVTALARNEPYGVWGGYTRVERVRALRRFRGDVTRALAAHDAGVFTVGVEGKTHEQDAQ